jgi:DNA-binding beta-propeller fold protein YncE
MTRQPSRRRPDIATAVIIGLSIAIGSAVATTAGATGIRTPRTIAVRHISVGGRPYSVAIDPRRRAVWVTTPQLVRISEATQKVTARVRGVTANSVGVDPVTGTVWTVNGADGTLTEVSEATNRVLHHFGNLGFSRAIAVDPRDHTLWVTSNESVLQVSEATRRVLHTVHIRVSADQVLGVLTVDPVTATVWVSVIPGDPRTSQTSVVQIGETSHRVLHTYSYDVPGTTSAITAVDPTRRTAWVIFGPFREPGRIEVISIAKRAVVRTIFSDPAAPQGIAIDPGTQTVIATGGVGGGHQDTVLLLSERSGRVIGEIPAALYPAQIALDQATGNVYVSINFHSVVMQFHE